MAMARTRRVKCEDGVANYHVMSRTNNKLFLFAKGRLKWQIVDSLDRIARFSGVRIHAYAVMDNHFHVVCRVEKPETPVSEEEVLRRIVILRGDRYADDLSRHWAELRKTGLERVAVAALNGWRRRMNDVSAFVKTFKEEVDRLYKRECPHCGSIWSGRFASTLVEDGKYLRTVIRYVELNPVRAGIATQARDYAWSSAKANEMRRNEGPVPAEGLAMREERLMRRVAQVGEGRILGGYAFVVEKMTGLGDRFAGRPVARAVCETTFTTHGWRLAKELAA